MRYDWRRFYPNRELADADMARMLREVKAVPKPFTRAGRKAINKIHANLNPLDKDRE